MKSKQFLFLLAGLAFFQGCRPPRPALVPEISSPLIQEEVCSWTGRPAGTDIFPCAGGIGWLDASGRIIAWDADKKSAAAVLELSFRVDAPPFRQGRFLVLKKGRADRRLLIIDLEKPAVLADLDGLKADVVLGIDGDHLVYLEGGRLTVNSWRQPGSVFQAAVTEERFFNCHFAPERILVMSEGFLHTFWKKSGRFESTLLPRPAISPFYCEGEHIYYGAGGRFLVKYSISKNRLAWKVKLGQSLERTPFVFAGSVVASPADQSLLLVNERGSIVWWQALRSTMSCDLLPMSENLAAVLLNREIKFIDPRRRQVTVFQGMERPLGPPLAFRRDLYFLAGEGEAWRLLRVGNRYGVDDRAGAGPGALGRGIPALCCADLAPARSLVGMRDRRRPGAARVQQEHGGGGKGPAGLGAAAGGKVPHPRPGQSAEPRRPG